MLRALGTKRVMALSCRPVRYYSDSPSFDPFNDKFKPNTKFSKFDRKANKGVSRDHALQVKNPHLRKEKIYPPPKNDGGSQFKIFGGQQRSYPVFEGKSHRDFLPNPPSLPNRLEKMHKMVENEADRYLRLLRLFVREPTIAKLCIEQGQTFAFHNMVQMIRNEFNSLGYSVTTPEFKHLDFEDKKKHPPFILARPASHDPTKPTIVVYANYDTVAVSEAGWAHAPYEMGRFEGSLTGRGVTSKAVVAAWMAALSVMHTEKLKPTANIRFCFDPMGELGAGALDTALGLEDTRFFKDADAIIVSQGQWNSQMNPNIVHGQRGCHNYYLNIEGADIRTDAGRFSGIRREPVAELMQLMSELVSIDQNTILPRAKNLDLHVAQPTEQETMKLMDLGISVDEIKDQVGSNQLKTGMKTELLEKMWSQPAVTIQSIKTGFEPEEEYPTSIPKHATARFAIRTVPNMDMKSVDSIVKRYFKELHRANESYNHMHIKMLNRYPWWLASTDHWSYDTAAQAITSVYNLEPEFTKEGGTSPAAALFEKHLRKSVLCLPIGLPTDMPRSVEENFSETNFINGIKTFISYMYYVGENARVTEDNYVSDTAFPLPIKLPPPLRQVTPEFNQLINASEEIKPPRGEPVLLSAEFDHNDYADRLEEIENLTIRTGNGPEILEPPKLMGPLTQEAVQLQNLLRETSEPSTFPDDYNHPGPYKSDREPTDHPQGTTKTLLQRLRAQLGGESASEPNPLRRARVTGEKATGPKQTRDMRGKRTRTPYKKMKKVKETDEEKARLEEEMKTRLFEG